MTPSTKLVEPAEGISQPLLKMKFFSCLVSPMSPCELPWMVTSHSENKNNKIRNSQVGPINFRLYPKCCGCNIYTQHFGKVLQTGKKVLQI